MRRLIIGLLILGTVGPARAEDTVSMPLPEWQRAEARLKDLRQALAARSAQAPVIVGETSYRGKSDGKNLHLRLTLRAQLPKDQAEKVVEVVGTDAIVVSAARSGRPVSLVPHGARWAYETVEGGPLELEVELVVPPRGPRGSIEYAFGVVESPVTSLEASFPQAGLQPEVSGAVTQEVRAQGGGTFLRATLGPTRTLHIVGFHDVDAAQDSGQAKLYGETYSLVSLSNDRVELFAVVGLTILYAPAKRFKIELPAGYELVSADGQGAFQYTVDTQGGRAVLVGETAFGMEQRYEISLRLRRSLAAGESRLGLPLLRLLEVERDAGFAAVEIPGKLSVEKLEGPGLVAIDVRELPAALVRSSVSPIVRALRYSGERGEATLEVARHPEKALAAGGVDGLRATSVLTEDGRLMTDLLFTVRNSLQQYLSLELPAHAEVKSAVLEGDPIKPSRDAEGRVLIPLRRSRQGSAGLVPFRVQLVYEDRAGPLGLAGAQSLELPRLLVPVASVEWSVWAPSTFHTTELRGDVEPQSLVKNAQWHRASGEELEIEPELDAEATSVTEAGGDEGEGEEEHGADEQAVPPPDPGDRATPATAEERASGAMPVRVQLPREGTRLSLVRFWVEAREPMRARFWYARTPLPLAAELLSTVLLAALAFAAWAASGARRRVLLALTAAGALGTLAGFGAPAVTYALALGAGGQWLRRGSFGARLSATRRGLEQLADGARQSLVAAWQSLATRYGELRARSLMLALAGSGARLALIAAKLMLATVLTSILVSELLRLYAVLKSPLSLP